MIGWLLALGFYLLSFLFPRPLALWLTIGLLVLLTGGLHLDGFSDTLDGLACRGTREKILEVMRDSRVGAFGVMGLILLIGAKYLALDQIADPVIPYALILMTVMGRNSMVFVCYRSPYARPDGWLGEAFYRKPRTTGVGHLFSVSLLESHLLLMGVKGIVCFLGILGSSVLDIGSFL